MSKKKNSLQETMTTIIIDGETEENIPDLHASLEEILRLEGVIGYIFKDATTAKIDLKEPEKTVKYALLASEAFDASKELQALFNLGKVENTIIECKNLKVLCAVVGESTVSVFMEKTADHAEIQKCLLQP